MTRTSVKDIKPQLPFIRPVSATSELLVTAEVGRTYIFRTTSSAAHAIGVTHVTVIVPVSGLTTGIVWGDFGDARQDNGLHGIDDLKDA